jgi:MFS family permease
MLPLATTELGTDSWITELVNPVMASLGVQAGWVLVYTAFVMMILRFFVGPFVEKLKPVGLLAVSSVIAIIGLLTLSEVTGSAIFLGATIYALGKSFFWPTMMGIVAERFPKGGALTLNTISGVGMLSVGVIGAAFLGNIQDREVDQHLQKNYPAVYAKVAGAERTSVFGNYQALNQSKISELNPEEKQWLQATTATAKKDALKTVAVFPLIMLVGYLILLGYFRRQGGYKPVELTE